MAKKKKFNPLKEYTETKKFTDVKTGYVVTVIRGMDSVNGVFKLPDYMNGRDFRKWRENTKREVDAWRNFECAGDVNDQTTIE